MKSWTSNTAKRVLVKKEALNDFLGEVSENRDLRYRAVFKILGILAKDEISKSELSSHSKDNIRIKDKSCLSN